MHVEKLWENMRLHPADLLTDLECVAPLMSFTDDVSTQSSRHQARANAHMKICGRFSGPSQLFSFYVDEQRDDDAGTPRARATNGSHSAPAPSARVVANLFSRCRYTRGASTEELEAWSGTTSAPLGRVT